MHPKLNLEKRLQNAVVISTVPSQVRGVVWNAFNQSFISSYVNWAQDISVNEILIASSLEGTIQFILFFLCRNAW